MENEKPSPLASLNKQAKRALFRPRRHMEDYTHRRLRAMLPSCKDGNTLRVTLLVHPFVDGDVHDYYRSKPYGLLLRVRPVYGDRELPMGWWRADTVRLCESELKHIAELCRDPEPSMRVRLLSDPNSNAIGLLPSEPEGIVGGIIFSSTETGSQVAVRCIADGAAAAWPLARVVLSSTTPSPFKSAQWSGEIAEALLDFTTPHVDKKAWTYDALDRGEPSPPDSDLSLSSAITAKPSPPDSHSTCIACVSLSSPHPPIYPGKVRQVVRDGFKVTFIDNDRCE